MSTTKIGLILCFFLLQIASTCSEVIPYNHHIIYPLRPEYLTIPKYAKRDAPNWPPGHGHSYIDLTRLKLRVNCYEPKVKSGGESQEMCTNSTLEILMFEEPTGKAWIDYWPERDFCCTQELINRGKCFEEGTLILPSTLPQAFVRQINVKADTEVTLTTDGSIAHHEITKSGVYVLFMAVCDAVAPSIIVDGSVDSLDPYGYLPGDLFGNLPFYGTLSCLYSVVGIVWLGVCFCYSNELMPLQMWITAVLGLGMLETTMLFAHYLNWNDLGTPTLSITIVGLIFGVTKRALSRIVVQFVALGYGVVRPSLGEDMRRVLYLGGAYFTLSLIYTLGTNIPSGAKFLGGPEYDMLSLVVFMLAGVDTTFYIWIITSINSLLVTLAARKQAVKYILYRNFRAVLFVSLFFTFVWALYGSVMVVSDGHGEDNRWKDRWTVDGLWELTYFAVFIAISVLWAPTKNSQRYAYSIELSQLEDDSEWQKSMESEVAEAEAEAAETEVDAEYGGKLHDEDDPFQGTGALDPAMAIQKKN